MMFPPNDKQAQAMRTHFLLHKNSIKRPFKCAKCNHKFAHMDYFMILQHEKSHEQKKLHQRTYMPLFLYQRMRKSQPLDGNSQLKYSTESTQMESISDGESHVSFS